MKISGFSIVKNAIALEYPVVESVLSLLPLVDEYVVLVGKSEDGTVDLLRSLGNDKIRIIEDEWRDEQRHGGELFSRLTNAALAQCTGEWAFYLQADEVIHEQDLPALQRVLAEESGHPRTKAVAMRIRNFHGDYWTYDPYSHRKVVRIIRNDGTLASTGDAVGFRLKSDGDGRLIQHALPDAVRWLNEVHLFHYSWVKSRPSLVTKQNLMEQHYYGDGARVFTDHQMGCGYARFRGRHPEVMSQRIARFEPPFKPYPNRWLDPRFYLHLLHHGYKR
jgi:glycosyltransferase involved in cell wall biosynthesis